MKDFICVLVAAVLVGFLGGYGVSLFRKNRDSQVEYASTTNEKFYHKMTKMKEGSVLIFNGFPTCLTSIFYAKPGEEILTAQTDTVYFEYRDLNREDINKYPYYVIKDNHNSKWSIFRHNDKFRLYREE